MLSSYCDWRGYTPIGIYEHSRAYAGYAYVCIADDTRFHTPSLTHLPAIIATSGIRALIPLLFQSSTSKWTVDHMPDLSGKVIIVTGGNTGIGRETVKGLLSHNARVYLACRSKEKGQEAIQELKEETGREAIFLPLDLANLTNVQKSAEEFLSKEHQLDVLFNNAGVMNPPIEETTIDGYDLQFGTNVLGHFFFTKLLLPALLAVSQNSPGSKSRVVNVSSSAAYLSKLHWETFLDGSQRRKTSVFNLYSQSKYGNVVFAQELGRRYGDSIISTSLHPGNIQSDVQRYISPFQHKIVNKIFSASVSFGALTQLWAGTSIEGLDLNNKYLIPWAQIGQIPEGADDPELGRMLWSWCEEQVAGR